MPPGVIRTHNLSRRADADLRLRPRGHWDRQHCVLVGQIKDLKTLLCLPLYGTEAGSPARKSIIDLQYNDPC